MEVVRERNSGKQKKNGNRGVWIRTIKRKRGEERYMGKSKRYMVKEKNTHRTMKDKRQERYKKKKNNREII